MGDATVTVRAVEATDEAAWKALYRGYRDFYRLDPDDAVVDRVWAWIQDATTVVEGIVAERDGQLVGLANHRAFHRPSTGTIGTYLDDLFVDPSVRRSGAATALLARLREDAAAQGRSVVRWITASDNADARSLYDREAAETRWVTYDMAPTPR
ncbi:GNAT family N-acetyltransferase [Agrococcus terreus]|uniref:N-acetyltransferase n=1 Tax=Agrococcus terreus TaxID=574649 RepID=A0ABQ2KN06_9MICO|nr:GNAT family N-acetyltransferase [Agrococcus terreus]GGN88192.1 N-acetyltransferase [Agrococcus terreus]